MHETKAKVERLCNVKHTITGWVEGEVAKGVECVNAHELGAAVDMVKDLAEAEEKLWKACYYKKIVEAMEEAEDEEEMYLKMMALDDLEGEVREGRMGYNPNRGMSGRYTRSGGDRTGHRMGYPGRTSRTDGNQTTTYSGSGNYPMNGRMGYPMDYHLPHDGEMMPPYMDGDMHYGKPYNDYKMYRKHYTSSKSQEDKAEMDKHAMEHVHDSIDTVREIWKDADPDLKRKMKTDFTKLVNDMT